MRRRGSNDRGLQEDLFSTSPVLMLSQRLARLAWPDADRFPVNHAGAKVATTVWHDALTASDACVVAGFASISQMIELVADRWTRDKSTTTRILLGTEPFATERVSFGSAEEAFNDDVRRYWVEDLGVSLRLSAKVVQTLEALDAGALQIRFIPGATRLHAKIYVTDDAVTLGSSNFTDTGLRRQFEANARFTRATEPERYDEARTVADNFWKVGTAWDEEFRRLLNDLLQFVPWQEALARACADLLEGQWASRYLAHDASSATLWPSQVTGIAEAMWVVENVGSVLVADATGSGKTRMGAHLARAVRDRLWSTGRVRGDLTVLVCPPAVEQQWVREAVSCGLTLQPVSQGLLSRGAEDGPRVQEAAVNQAQVLAIDEAHNFLTTTSNRTRHVRESTADHVLLFTATPINRGAEDLLALVDLLGADNFEDATLDVLDQLGRRGGNTTLTEGDKELLRGEIQRFTVRRTKTMLNAMVDQDPEAFRHPGSGRVCRYPDHEPHTYPTGETEADEQAATRIREHANALLGVSQLGRVLAVPGPLRREFTDDRWLALRLSSASGLASHHVLRAMRSSTAALVEHLVGTHEAVQYLGITGLVKPQPTGDVLSKVRHLLEAGPPQVELTCEVPGWLLDEDAWRTACNAELERYTAILHSARGLTGSRERAKAEVLVQLAVKHGRILAFDHHPITLAAIGPLVRQSGTETVVASGADPAARKQVRKSFGRDSTRSGVALCSDAMSEGLNLQGASAIVHFDLPTTLRVAEQRVGRVDRMDSPYAVIEAWWPDDGAAFKTHANELLAARNLESSTLLGSNLLIPDAVQRSDQALEIADVTSALLSQPQDSWDGIRDALDPVRLLASGPDALISPAEYAAHRDTAHRVLARVSPVQSTDPWAFFALRGHDHGAPHWILLDGPDARVVTGLQAVSEHLRHHLRDNPPSRPPDAASNHWLDCFLVAASKAEWQLLPRRLQRALEQMRDLCATWSLGASRDHDYDAAERWGRIGRLIHPGADDTAVDLRHVAEIWLQLVQPLQEQARTERRRTRYARIRDIDPQLKRNPLRLDVVESKMSRLHAVKPTDQRVTACILGVPH